MSEALIFFFQCRSILWDTEEMEDNSSPLQWHMVLKALTFVATCGIEISTTAPIVLAHRITLTFFERIKAILTAANT